jgi:SAM-dependent methyltransferase
VYGRDLAAVHDAGFDFLARGGTATLLRELRRAGLRHGRVVDLGCGSGVTAELLTREGYDVLGIDPSTDMLALARERAPGASFVQASLHDAELPPCVAVTALGEVLNFAWDDAGGPAQIHRLFARIAAALAPGGLFLLDVAEPGREGGRSRRAWHEGPGWTLCLDAAEDPDEPVLRRRIVLFRGDGAVQRRTEEVQGLRLIPREDVVQALAATGFDAGLLPGYGRALRFRRGWAGILAVRRP